MNSKFIMSVCEHSVLLMTIEIVKVEELRPNSMMVDRLSAIGESAIVAATLSKSGE